MSLTNQPVSQASLRVSKSAREIISILEKSKSMSGVFIWQSAKASDASTPIADSRNCFDVKIVNVDPIQQKVSVEVLGAIDHLRLDECVFVKAPHRESAFKSVVVGQNGKQLILDFPYEMIVTELRSHPRIAFKESDKKFVTIRKTSSSDLGLANGMNVQALNVSKMGLGLLLSNLQVQKINDGDQLELLGLGETNLGAPIQATVVTRISSEKQNQMGAKEVKTRIGLKLAAPLPDEVYESFSFVENLAHFDDARFFKDQAFRDSVRRGMTGTVAKLTNKDYLRDLFKLLEVKREGNRYLKNHIELLCEVMCKVGTDVGWVSERNLEKLIYVSYLHDVRYFEQPHLAKIQSKRDFDFMKSKMSKEEQKLFLEGPEYAAALAKEDESAYSDADKILLQHRERPSGKGMPLGLKGSQLAPLSCLFMVCHEFVDYLIQEPEWNYKEFLARYRKEYVGPYFNRIFQVFEELA